MIGRFPRLFSIALLASSLVLGCHRQPNTSSDPSNSDNEVKKEQKAAPPLPAIADFGPLDTKPGSQLLIAQQSKMPVTMQVTAKGEDFLIDLLFDGTAIESEGYSLKDGVLSLASASDIEFKPPIPLFSKSSRVSQKKTWDGNVIIAAKAFPATAEISVTPSEVRPEDLDPLSAYEVDVDLKFGDPGAKPLRQSFWLSPGLGIVKRAFASGTSREPTAP